MASRQRVKYPLCAKRVRVIEKQLREMYALKGLIPTGMSAYTDADAFRRIRFAKREACFS